MGLITNFLSIIIGGILGLTIGKKFNEDMKEIIKIFEKYKEKVYFIKDKNNLQKILEI